TAPPPPAELAEDVPPEQLRLLAAAARALGMTGAPGALQLLPQHLGSPSAYLRSAAFEGLAFLGKEGLALARRGLVDSDRAVQAATAWALAAQGEPGQQLVLQALSDRRVDAVKLLD